MSLVRKQTFQGALNIVLVLLTLWFLKTLIEISDSDTEDQVTVAAAVSRNSSIYHNNATRNNDQRLPRSPHCRFRVPTLHKKVQFTCGRGDFVSVVKSVCKTQLGNQLSSYAALLYFTSRFGYHAFLDPVQTRALGQVFNTSKLSIGAFNFYSCGCVPGAQHWVRPLELHSTGVAERITEDWDPGEHVRGELIGLGPHSVPLFLIREILVEAREEFVFKDKIMKVARRIINLMTGESDKESVIVGVHARRGDKLRVWRQSGLAKNILGRYEGSFFRYSMDLMRRRYNSETRKVVFIVTSDNMTWAKTQLGNSTDTFYSSDHTRAPPTGPTALGVDLAVLSLAHHTIMDYGTFGLWAGLLAGGTILAPTGYTRAGAESPDMVWWRAANMSSVELIDITNMTHEE